VRSTFNVARAVAWRTLHNVFTNPSLLIPSIVFPLFFFTAFAGGLSRVSSVPGFDYPLGYTSFQFVFVLLQSAAFGGVFTGFGIARDFESGFARRLLLAAPHRSGIVLGYGIAALVRWMFTATVLTVVALAVGMNVGGNGVDLFGLYALAVILNIAALLWACGVAMRFRTLQAGPVMQFPVFIAWSSRGAASWRGRRPRSASRSERAWRSCSASPSGPSAACATPKPRASRFFAAAEFGRRLDA
jgi:hypothetical protein